MTETTTLTLHVGSQEAGERLDRYVAAHSALSRSQVQRHIEEGHVTVNGRSESAHYLVRALETIHLAMPPAAERHRELIPTVVAEGNGYLVIEKPAGLLSHGGQGRETSLVEWLRERVPELDAVGELDRPGIVHRLDRGVSGLLVVATTPQGYAHLKEQFAARQVVKEYTALVIGAPAEEEGVIDFPLARSRSHRGRMAARPKSGEGKEAVTRYAVLRRLATTTLLKVRILTGRTHQIRAHLFAKGLPIVGDTLYPSKKHLHLPPLNRPFLHSSRLAFSDPTGQWGEWTSPLPEELAAYLAALPA